MPDTTTGVVVIGGGSTGAGVLRDLSMRGIDAVLVEKGDLASGTTGRSHGLLHSGGRYCVSDLAAAIECVEEGRILRRIARTTIEDTGGYFVSVSKEDEAWEPRFVEGCGKAGITCERISVEEARRREPALSKHVRTVFWIPEDGHLDPFYLVMGNVESARRHPRHHGRQGAAPGGAAHRMGRGATHDRGRVADGRRRQHRASDPRLCRRAAALRPGRRGRGPGDEPQLCRDRPRAARRDCRLYQHRGRQSDDLPADGGAGHRPGRAPAWGNHALHDRRGPAQRSRRRAGPVAAPPRATGPSQAARRRAPPSATRLRVRARPAAGRGALVRGCRGPHPRRHSPPHADRYGSLPGGDLLLSAGRAICDRPSPGRPDGDPGDGRSAGNALARGAPRLLGQSAAAGPGDRWHPPGAVHPRPPADAGKICCPTWSFPSPSGGGSGWGCRNSGGRQSAMKADVAVVGSGLAALVATRTLQQAGRNAVLIWPGLSSLYFTYATVDVL